MYRGEHHPTDILASVLFAALWLTAATMLIKPNKDGLEHGTGRGLLGLSRVKDTARHRHQSAAPASTGDKTEPVDGLLGGRGRKD
jgi:hypothetical protein